MDKIRLSYFMSTQTNRKSGATPTFPKGHQMQGETQQLYIFIIIIIITIIITIIVTPITTTTIIINKQIITIANLDE